MSLPLFSPLNSLLIAIGAISKPRSISTRYLSLPTEVPMRKLANHFFDAAAVVWSDESLNAQAFGNGHREIVRAGDGIGGVVLADQPADHDPTEVIHHG